MVKLTHGLIGSNGPRAIPTARSFFFEPIVSTNSSAKCSKTKTSIQLVQGSRTHIGRRATFYRKNAPRAALRKKNDFAGRNLQEKPSK